MLLLGLGVVGMGFGLVGKVVEVDGNDGGNGGRIEMLDRGKMRVRMNGS